MDSYWVLLSIPANSHPAEVRPVVPILKQSRPAKGTPYYILSRLWQVMSELCRTLLWDQVLMVSCPGEADSRRLIMGPVICLADRARFAHL